MPNRLANLPKLIVKSFVRLPARKLSGLFRVGETVPRTVQKGPTFRQVERKKMFSPSSTYRRTAENFVITTGTFNRDKSRESSFNLFPFSASYPAKFTLLFQEQISEFSSGIKKNFDIFAVSNRERAFNLGINLGYFK